MNFLWADSRVDTNIQINFKLNLEKPCDKVKICAADFFRVFADGKLISYGPCRTAEGFCRPKTVKLNDAKEICVSVLSNHKASFCCDLQKPYFAAEVYHGEKIQYDSEDFIAYKNKCKIQDVPRYSSQRGYLEVYDFVNFNEEQVETYCVESPTLISELTEVCDYKEIVPKRTEEFGDSFYATKKPWWTNNYIHRVIYSVFDIEKDFLKRIEQEDFHCQKFVFDIEKTGLFRLIINSEENVDVFITFEEMLPDGNWIFGRSGCNDLIAVKAKAGKTEIICSEPYALKYVKVFTSVEAQIDLSLILIQNDRVDCVKVDGDDKIKKIFEAARNTFSQNAVDIFMDCPGRERAGWLCDTFFTAKSELLFTGKNEIEKAFLENILIADVSEIAKNMIPKCFPSQHVTGEYIPNWAMWFVVELKDYLLRTGDRNLVEKAKEKVYGVVDFFNKYLNEYGLLENLESWVFIEWSICNSKEYIEGVNFPSNMLYAHMLDAVDYLYGDIGLKEHASNIRKCIKDLSFNGEFFCDNAIRNNSGELVVQKNHVSETCQYYALFTGIDCPIEYKNKIKKQFGPFRKDEYPEVGRSNMFIGNYLRLFWLYEEKEFDTIVKESVGYFYDMAKKTGTLWEHDNSKASCNHGFASVIAVLLLSVTLGYQGVKDGDVILSNEKDRLNSFGLTATFDYKKSK